MKPAVIALLAAGTPILLQGEEEPAFHFQHDIAPHLARAGCAAADCHGGATGRGGFKLSLFATNARADYEAITQDLAGRRVDYTDPSQSLVLRKPTRQVRHKGGRVIDPGSPAYHALHKWIRDGAPFSRGKNERLTGLAVERRESQLAVTATFSTAGGKTRQRDVTELARFESTNDQVVSVDRSGSLTLQGEGEGWILAHYGLLSARLPIRRPFGPPEKIPETAHPLDEVWSSRLTELGLRPAAPVDKFQLIRRLYLDLCGRPPSPREIRQFRSMTGPDRFERTVSNLLQTEEFAAQLSRHLESWLELPDLSEDLHYTRERNARLRAITRSFAKGDGSLLDFATSIFLQPRRREFVNRFSDPRDRAEFTGRALLGLSIGCARCHNHPADRWTQAQHLKFSAYFTDERPVPGNPGSMAPGMFFLPGDGKPVEPALLPLAGPMRNADSSLEHPTQLARFLREEADSAFARNAANRVFGLLIGKHLVEAPDDHRTSNPAVHEPVLDLLAGEFARSEFRLRPLFNLIVTSRLYAAGADPVRKESLSGDPELHYLARREARAMSSDQFLRAVTFVLGVDQQAGPVPDTPLAQQLHLLNSGLFQKWLQAPGNQVDAIFEFVDNPEQQLHDLFLLILARPPRPAERAEFLPLLTDGNPPRTVGRDLAFALLASREFSSIR